MRNIDRCSCGGAETDTEIPGTPGPDGEDFVDNDYLFATEDSPEWYDEDEHARRRYVQPDPEINENVYSVTEDACQDDQCSEPCEEAPDCGDACNCNGGETGDCSDVCQACGCAETPASAQRRGGSKKGFDAQRAREESIRRNHARAAQRRKVLQDTVDADERIRRRENALKQQEARAEGKLNGESTAKKSAAGRPEFSSWPEDLYVSPQEIENMEAMPYEKKVWPEIPVFDVGAAGDFAGVYPNEQPSPAYQKEPAGEIFVSQAEPEPRRSEKVMPAPRQNDAYNIYEKAERFAEETMTNGCDGSGEDNGSGEGECECCCKGEDCYAPDYYACELDEDCCNPENAFFMQGSFGDEVRKIQRCIKSIPEEQGGTSDLEVDGIYGPNTAMAVMRFQEQHDIPADGVTNKKTRARMQNLCQSSSS